MKVIYKYKANSRKYRGIFEEHSPKKSKDKFGKSIGL